VLSVLKSGDITLFVFFFFRIFGDFIRCSIKPTTMDKERLGCFEKEREKIEKTNTAIKTFILTFYLSLLPINV